MIKQIEKCDFKCFFVEHYAGMVRFAQSFLFDREEAEDFVQEVFVCLYERWNGVRDINQARSFMYISIRNLCISHLRHQIIKEKFALLSLSECEMMIDEEMEDEVIYQETLRKLHLAIEHLPMQSKRIIQLSLEGKSNLEIAQELDISINSVKTLKKGAYKKLREEMKIHDNLLLVFMCLSISGV